MRRIRLVCLLVGAVLLAGCTGSNEPTLVPAQLPHLVLQPDDLGDRYDRFDEGKLAIADRPTGSRVDPGRFGRRDGWKARYREIADTGAAAVVESRVDLFADADGAKRELTAHRDDLEADGAGQVEARSRLGEEAFVLVRTAVGSGASFVTIAWREANVAATVVVNGIGPETADEALRLARLQQDRIRSTSQK